MTSGAGVVVQGIGNRNINLDFSIEGKGKGKGGSEGMWWHNSTRNWNWRYWMVDMWVDGSWRVEGQTAVDWVVERLVVVDDI